ncbi:MAG: class I SAM-dependent methyltransferase [Theionarchaea archaeon]|nr:class I SAM-dependent methyltransferase [Theionarchaea archaeon]MBU6999594.1 class I SAM-dependent methyltransferase [Theionarchaea archaeon]MBU7020256.1 class I SAM-dependent methyltransferase [Theionarchaea archaeon]MBU7035641.1 class I SAM-dependent methyltransferase [Theionarchaea archaeon]MBU7041201.1 class I SAM-dependent methyltransferase [Theionarchaea archaeon]
MKGEDARDTYSRLAESYDAMFSGGMWAVYDALTWKYIEDYLPGEGVILDAGGGTGKWSMQLARRGYTVHLVDVSPEMLAEASEKIEGEGLKDRIFVQEGDITALDFSSDYFDFVLSEGDPVSYCAENHFQAIKELVRVAKPKSYIEIGVDSRYMFFMRQSVLHGFTEGESILEKGIAVDKRGTRTFTFTPRVFKEEFDEAGADLVKVVGKPVFITFGSAYLEDLGERLETDAEFRKKILTYEIALNEEGFGPVGNHLQAIAQKR